MSELKAVHAFDVYEAYTKTGDDDAAQVYLKSEADNVIAEKDSEIARLKAKIEGKENEFKYFSNSFRKKIAELKARITDNSDLIETLSNELEKLRPMETALEIAEADNKKYIARIKELEKEIYETHKSYDALLNERNKLAHELHTIKKTMTEEK